MGKTFLNKLWMSDEALFHLNEFDDKQNLHYWEKENPNQLHQDLLHSKKVTVWCSVSFYGVIGPFFENEFGFVTTVKSAQYVVILKTFVAQELEIFLQIFDNSWFHLDGSTSHTAQTSMAALHQLFYKNIILRNSTILWSPSSLDLSAGDFFLKPIHELISMVELKSKIQGAITKMLKCCIKSCRILLRHYKNVCARVELIWKMLSSRHYICVYILKWRVLNHQMTNKFINCFL